MSVMMFIIVPMKATPVAEPRIVIAVHLRVRRPQGCEDVLVESGLTIMASIITPASGTALHTPKANHRTYQDEVERLLLCQVLITGRYCATFGTFGN